MASLRLPLECSSTRPRWYSACAFCAANTIDRVTDNMIPAMTFAIAMTSLRMVRYEFVSDAMHGLNVNRTRRIRFEFGAQCGDVVVHGPGDGIGIESPDLVQQFVASDDRVFARREKSQKVEFFPRHLDRFSTPAGLVLLKVDFHLSELERCRKTGRRSRAAQKRANPCHELRNGEGFRHIIVGAKIQTEDPVGFFAARGQDQDRNLVAFGPQLSA